MTKLVVTLAGLSSAFLLLATGSAFSADDLESVESLSTRPGGFVAKTRRLHQASVRLERVVSRAYLGERAQRATRRLERRAQRLVRCAFQSRLPHGGNTGGPRITCRHQIERVQRVFGRVADHLRGTEYRYPRVHRRFVETRQALRAVTRPGRARFVARGYMNNRRFHFAARSLEGIRRDCLKFTRWNNIYTVDQLTVNGQRIRRVGWGRPIRAQRACRIVTNHARSIRGPYIHPRPVLD